MDSAFPTRPPAFIQGLTGLPRELVHKVLDDLSVEKILQIISHKIAYLDSCITSHLRYGRLFRSQVDIDSVVEYYILFRDMKRWTRTSLSLSYSLQTYGTPTLGWNYEAQLRAYLLSSIREHADLSTTEKEILSPWISDPCPDLPASRAANALPQYLARWNWIKAAKGKLNEAKAAHWIKAASLITTNPGRLMLKKPTDPDQGAPRPNVEHIANRMRSISKKVLQDHTLIYDYSSCGHEIEGIILVPYDRYLWSFLEVIQNCPPESEMKAIMKDLKDLSISNEKEHIGKGSEAASSVYPVDILTSLKLVMDGLAQVYTGSPLRIVPRINWPSAPRVGHTVQKPTFLICKTYFAGMHLCPTKRRMPHDTRELEWLEAFLKVVTWMEENMELLEKKVV